MAGAAQPATQTAGTAPKLLKSPAHQATSLLLNCKALQKKEGAAELPSFSPLRQTRGRAEKKTKSFLRRKSSFNPRQ